MFVFDGFGAGPKLNRRDRFTGEEPLEALLDLSDDDRILIAPVTRIGHEALHVFGEMMRALVVCDVKVAVRREDAGGVVATKDNGYQL